LQPSPSKSKKTKSAITDSPRSQNNRGRSRSPQTKARSPQSTPPVSKLSVDSDSEKSASVALKKTRKASPLAKSSTVTSDSIKQNKPSPRKGKRRLSSDDTEGNDTSTVTECSGSEADLVDSEKSVDYMPEDTRDFKNYIGPETGNV